jgi:ADP-heptose:LPS heptosyltransferase
MKVLVIRFSSIGDVVLTTPVLRTLYLQKNAEIHYLTKSAFAPIVLANPHVQRVFALGAPLQHERVTAHASLREITRLLRAERYDVVIDLHHNLRSMLVKQVLRRPAHSFDKLNFEKWLLVKWGINRLPKRHVVDRYMDTLKSLGVRYDGAGLDFFIPAQEQAAAQQYLTEHAPELLQQPFTALVIGAAHATKRLPLPQLIRLCQAIPGPIAVLGGPTDATTADALTAAFPDGRLTNLCGRLSLFGSAAVLQWSARVVAHDTGLMHIAAALQRPLTVIWGSTVPAFGMGPLYRDYTLTPTHVQDDTLTCRPCSKIGFDHCPKGHFRCMNGLKFDETGFFS